MTKKIICVGAANIDRKFKTYQAINPATSNPVSSTTSFGGVARNVAENLARWTNEIYLHCIVGNDNEGHDLLGYMRELGVNTDCCMIDNEHHTSYYYAVLDQNGELNVAYADMDIYTYASSQSLLHTYEHWQDDSILFLDTNFPADVINNTLIYGKEKNLTICIDPVSIAKSARLPHQLDHVFLIKPNQLELAALTGMHIKNKKDCIHAGRKLLNRGVKNVIVSMGSEGYFILNETQEHHVPAMKIDNIKDVNGAGDAFFAGILYGLQQNSSIMQACELGAAAAALTLQSHQSVSQHITASSLSASVQDLAMYT